MKDNEKKLSGYIDRLNEGQQKDRMQKTKTGFVFIRRTLIFTSVTAIAAVIVFSSMNYAFHRRSTNTEIPKALPTYALPGGYSAIDSEQEQIPESKNTETANKPQIEVPVDLEAEQNEQKSVDAGHSPWKLDPVFVTQVFASLLLSPEGITGDYPIAYDNITIVENNGTDAKAEIKDDKSIAKYVYLKRLVRQDDTGIWTVVGYDKAD